MEMTSRKPSKPWRVKARAGDLDTKDFRGQNAAYDYAHTLLNQGLRVRIQRWEAGFWGEYVSLDPEEIARGGEDDA